MVQNIKLKQIDNYKMVKAKSAVSQVHISACRSQAIFQQQLHKLSLKDNWCLQQLN